MTSKRLVLLFDGTSNDVGSSDIDPKTNVFRLMRAIAYEHNGTNQITHYYSGVATKGDLFSAATGRGFDQIIREAYVNLSANFLGSDEIYIFGFSRGAAAARALCELLSRPGLIAADHLEIFPYMWEEFLLANEKRDSDKVARLQARYTKYLFWPQPKVRFLGLFDTVPGTDYDWLKVFTKVRFRIQRLSKSVINAIHLLSFDDNRNPSFSPILWNEKDEDQHVEQIWMPGVHADIGGSSGGRILGNVALLTMIDRVQHLCPELGLDHSLIEEVKGDIASTERICITSERPGFTRKLLLKGNRNIGEGIAELAHSIFGMLDGNNIEVRGRSVTYGAETVKDLPVAATSYDAFILNQIIRALRFENL